MSILLQGLMTVATKLFTSFASVSLLEWLLFYVAEQIVKRTDTPHDDVFLDKIKEAYKAG